MGSLQIGALVVLILAVLVIVHVAVRRQLLSRSGAVDMCWRDRLADDGTGWYLGVGKFDGADLYLYRSFSVLPMPNRRLHRADLSLGPRRPPAPAEKDLLPGGAVISRCQAGNHEFELAMSADAVTGLSAWLESMPPSNRSTGRLRRTG
ncbi:DUF2550 domain-containing protein [Nakamurella deserti]|uniref:DUF2550 domain-containing protein n=1 Tax=Nakamurella deserti TaxID=2164074 RepID=UPI000DBE25CA|nr:DUF2550 domain-containing protein [Nakamurella deserti]